ncbi:hypothetical protein Acsp03_28310 [Actinomadura sp. NBRC 104412]|nr:hypothetical protein Acsp03_28310 [Actinomadura sp. NBRC 104412]
MQYLIKSGGSRTGYYSQWGGLTLELDLLAGPETALRFVRGQRAVGGWLNEMQCDGAAIIDPDERRLLWFSHYLRDAAYRAAVLEVMTLTWQGWRLDWAYDGLREIVDALGEDGRKVQRLRTIPVPDDLRTPEEFMSAMPQFHLSPEAFPPGSEMPRELPLGTPVPAPAPDDDEPELACLVTVVKNGLTRAYMADMDASWVIESGVDSLTDLYEKWEPVTRWPSFPSSGVHLNADSRTGGAWTFSALNQVLNDAETFWPGWRWEFWRDRYREHLNRIGTAIDLPGIDFKAGLQELRSKFDAHQVMDKGTRAASMLLGLIGALRSAAESNELTVQTESANAMVHRPMDLTPEEKGRVHAALTALRYRS